MALNKRLRIGSATRVNRVFSATRPLQHDGLAVRALKVPRERTTFAVTVPVAVAPKAVDRNALRRLISEQLRILLKTTTVRSGYRAVISARSRYVQASGVRDALVLLLGKSGILQQ